MGLRDNLRFEKTVIELEIEITVPLAFKNDENGRTIDRKCEA